MGNRLDKITKRAVQLGLSDDIADSLMFNPVSAEEKKGMSKQQVRAIDKDFKDKQQVFIDGGFPIESFEEIMHPDITETMRLKITKFGDPQSNTKDTLATLRKDLPEKTHDVHEKNGRYYVKTKAEKKYKVLDPELMSVRQLLSDEEIFNAPVTEMVKETGREYVEAIPSLLKEVAPKAAGVFGGVAGAAFGRPIVGAMVASGLTSSALEAARQFVGMGLGVREDMDWDQVLLEGTGEAVTKPLFGLDVVPDSAKKHSAKVLLKQLSELGADSSNMQKLKVIKDYVAHFPKKVELEIPDQFPTEKVKDFMKPAVEGIETAANAADDYMRAQKGLVQQGAAKVGRLIGSGYESLSDVVGGSLRDFSRKYPLMQAITKDPALFAGNSLRKVLDYAQTGKDIAGKAIKSVMGDNAHKQIDVRGYKQDWEDIIGEARIRGNRPGALDHVKEELLELEDLYKEAMSFDHIVKKPKYKSDPFTGVQRLVGEDSVKTRKTIADTRSVQEFEELIEGLNPSHLFERQKTQALTKAESASLRVRQGIYKRLKDKGLHGPEGEVNGIPVGLSKNVKTALRDLDQGYMNAKNVEEYLVKNVPDDPNNRSLLFNEQAYDFLVNINDNEQGMKLLNDMDNLRLIMPKTNKFSLNVGDRGFSTYAKDLQTFDQYGDIRNKFDSAAKVVKKDNRSQQAEQRGAGLVAAGTHSGYGIAKTAVSGFRKFMQPKRVMKNLVGEGMIGKPLSGKYHGSLSGLLASPIPTAVKMSKAAGRVAELPGEGLFKMLNGRGEQIIGRLPGGQKMSYSNDQFKKISRSASRDATLKSYAIPAYKTGQSEKRKEMESERNQGVMQKQNSWQGVR